MTVYAITLAFCKPSILRQSVHAFHATRNLNLDIAAHVIVDQHYPLHREDMKKTLLHLSTECTIIDPGKNLGLHEGFNWAMRQLPLHDDDIVIGYDPDSLPISNGWDMALVRAIEGKKSAVIGAEDEIVWATLGNPRTLSDIEERGYDEAIVDGYLRIWKARTAITNSVCAWRYGWLRSVGFLREPRAFYGHLEAEMFGCLQNNQRWAILPDFRESDDLRKLHDREYVAYKWFHSHTNTWQGDFESYVNAGCPGLAISPSDIP